MKIDETFRNSAKIVLRFFGIYVNNVIHLDIHPEDFNIELSAYIGITGNPTGLSSIEMKMKTALSISSKISNISQTSLEEISDGIIRELVNQICGNAITELWQYGYDSEMTPPSIITGDQILFHHSKKCKESFFLFETNCGKIILKTFLELK